eukprot:COSAG06_NODE_10943_length_1593_cov_1.047523_3_plen_60_part_01
MDGQENILFINVVSCPEGLKNLAEKTPGDPLSLSLSLSLPPSYYTRIGIGMAGTVQSLSG